VAGHASRNEGEGASLELSERRAAVVGASLERLGFAGSIRTEGHGDERRSEDPAADRIAWVVLGDGRGQTAALHEFGHAFGLGDEYDGPKADVGEGATHDDLVKRMRDEFGQPLPGAIHEDNEGVMSRGDEIRPQHYATFQQALTDLTGITAWRIGAPQ
jgi:hypothetical protein